MATGDKLKRWAFTINLPDADWETKKDTLVKTLRAKASRFVFQLERAESGQLHFQGRCSFKQVKRTAEASHLLLNAHVSREANEEGSEFYSTKEESRIAGPWTEKTTRPIRVIPRWNPSSWNSTQRYIIDALEAQNDREILFVVDTEGHKGKTTLAMHYETMGKGLRLPTTLSSAQDFLRYVHNNTEPFQDVTLFMDVPRSVETKEQWRKWCTVAEELKNGFVYDDRYSSRRHYLNKTRICVFANDAPPPAYLTGDRFKIHIAGNEAPLPAEEDPSAGTAAAAAAAPNPWEDAALATMADGVLSDDGGM